MRSSTSFDRTLLNSWKSVARIKFKKTPLVAVLQDELGEFLGGGSGCESAQQFDALLVQLVRKCDGGRARPSRRSCSALRNFRSFVGLELVHALLTENCRSTIVSECLGKESSKFQGFFGRNFDMRI